MIYATINSAALRQATTRVHAPAPVLVQVTLPDGSMLRVPIVGVDFERHAKTQLLVIQVHLPEVQHEKR
jgi:hypothetical protein